MSSVIDMTVCPKCGKTALYGEYYYRSGEHYASCLHCGYAESFEYKHNETQYELEKTQYSISELFLVSKNYEGQSFRYAIPLFKYGNLTVPKIKNLLRKTDEFDNENSYRTICKLENGEWKPIVYWGGDFYSVENGILTVANLIPEEENSDGNGIMCIQTKRHCMQTISFEENSTKEDVMHDIELLRNDDKVAGIFCTWKNPLTNEIEVLAEDFIPYECEEDVEDVEGPREFVHMDDDDLPF